MAADDRGFGAGAMLRALAGLGAMLVLIAGCSSLSFGPSAETAPVTAPTEPGVLPAPVGETIGNGPVRVALLLPLSGSQAVSVGTSMLNATRLAMSFIGSNPSMAENITIVVKDTGGNPATAAARASEAVNEGARLILGPLLADEVRSAGAVARAAGLPLIGFSNNSGAAGPGVFLLNVLPEAEVRRSLSYAQTQGRQAFAAIVPTTDFGRVQEGAFRQAVADLGLTSRAVYTFSDEAGARAAVQQVLPLLQAGSVDALFLPDRATAPSIGVLLEEAGIAPGSVTIIGSADWDGDSTITQTPFLNNAVYPAVDDAGIIALRSEYQATFGGEPHPLSTIAYTAALLANTSTLALGTPPYDRAQLTRPSGYNGRDGLFRFLADGRSEYALIMKRVTPTGGVREDGPRL